MASTTEFNAKTGLCVINTANANLDGTGSVQQVIVGTLPSGTVMGSTIIRSVTIKATQATTQGMIRFFLSDGVSFWLIKEVAVPEYTPTGILPAFSITVSLPITLKPNYSLYVSTQNSQSFNIFADCMSVGSCACKANCDCGSNVEFESINGAVNISTSNPNLDGTGSLGLVYTAGGNNNCVTLINSIVVKAAQNISQGMIRLFVSRNNNFYLFCEVPVTPTTTNNGVIQAFSMNFPANFCLESGVSLYASTENSESFNVFVNGVTINCCGCPQ